MDWGYPLTQPGASYGMGGAAAPAAPTSPFGSGGFTSMLNSLSGALPDINNGIQTLAYGIGSFAKDPRKRAMYIQAALEHQKAMSSDKAAHIKALEDQGNQLLDFVVKSNGNPQVMNILDPVAKHHYEAYKTLAGTDAADNWLAQYHAGAAMPATAKDAGSTIGKIQLDLKNGLITQQQADAAIAKETALSTAGAGSPLGKLAEDLKAGRITQAQFDAAYQKEIYRQPPAGAAPPAPLQTTRLMDLIANEKDPARKAAYQAELARLTAPPSSSSQEVIAPILAKVAKLGRGALTPAEQEAFDMYAQTNPLAIMQRNLMPPAGGTAPAAPPPAAAATAAPPAPNAAPQQTAPAPAPAATNMPTGQSKDAPIPITPDNSVAIVKGIVATGQPMWLQGPDGKVEQVTPENAKAWLQLHKVQ